MDKKLRAVIAIDSFKGSLTSLEAGNAAAEGLKRVFPEADAVVRPLADGGEGTVCALIEGLNGQYKEVQVSDPLERRIKARYGILPNGTAVIEMASASGLTHLSEEERDPMETTTFGTGELILDALKNGCRRFIIGVGGSATNDGGAGCLQALGFGLLDKYGQQIGCGARGLSQITAITYTDVVSELKECSFFAACDVTNPLCGENGCSTVFSPQKGAAAADIPEMDDSLRKFALLTKSYNSSASPDSPGAGAAGGLGFALMYYLNAELRSGAELIISASGLEESVKNADIILTGEGCLDGQTAIEKAPVGVAKMAKNTVYP